MLDRYLDKLVIAAGVVALILLATFQIRGIWRRKSEITERTDLAQRLAEEVNANTMDVPPQDPKGHSTKVFKVLEAEFVPEPFTPYDFYPRPPAR